MNRKYALWFWLSFFIIVEILALIIGCIFNIIIWFLIANWVVFGVLKMYNCHQMRPPERCPKPTEGDKI